MFRLNHVLRKHPVAGGVVIGIDNVAGMRGPRGRGKGQDFQRPSENSISPHGEQASLRIAAFLVARKEGMELAGDGHV